MLKVEAKGDEHPKAFVLETDNQDGELLRLQEILKEVDALDKDGEPTGDPIGEWFAATDQATFAQGAVIPQDFAPDFIELLGWDWYEEAVVPFEREREDALKKAEAAMEEGDD